MLHLVHWEQRAVSALRPGLLELLQVHGHVERWPHHRPAEGNHNIKMGFKIRTKLTRSMKQ